jgi:hypothetical protein
MVRVKMEGERGCVNGKRKGPWLERLFEKPDAG